MKIAIGSDHGGYELKARIAEFLKRGKYDVDDMGTHSKDSCDYPVIGFEVARAVSSGMVDRGVLVCKTGIGMSMAANKVRGVRAALCGRPDIAVSSKEHNDSNVLVLGSMFVNVPQAKRILAAWLSTEFEGGRHQKRLRQIQKIEEGIRCCKK